MDHVAERSPLVKSKEIVNVDVINNAGENLGKIYEIVLDKISGQVQYAVLESGSFLGLGGKFFAIPWNSLKYDTTEDSFKINISKEQLKNSPGFDKDHWPTASDNYWRTTVTEYYRGL